MSSTIDTVTLVAPDISCGHCVMTIKDEVGALAGIASVEANPDTKRIEIAYDPTQVTLAQIEGVLDEAGYPVAR